MSYSILDMGRSTKAQAQGSLNTLAKLEQNRDMTNKGLKQQKKTNQLSGAASGAAIGAQMGSSAGPYGIAIGAAVGFLAGSL